MHRYGLLGLMLLAAAERTAASQTAADGSIDIGGALLRQSGLPETNVVTAAGQLRFVTPTFSFTTNGVAARTPEDRYTGQGVLSLSRYAPPARTSRWELGATGSAFGLSGLGPTLGGQLLAREHLGWSLGGIFAGGAAGIVTQSGSSHAVLNAHTGGFFRFDPIGRDELSGALVYTDAGVPPDSGTRLRYGDAIGYWTHRTHGLELLIGGGLRVNSTERSRVLGWGSASAVLWITDGIGIVLTGGHALADASRGVPSARYLSASLRLGTSGRGQGTISRVHIVRPDEDGGRIDVRVGSDSMRVVTVHLPLATTIELMADFTDWESVTMAQLPNGDWTIERPIAAGTHRVAIRVNGGQWAAPPNLPRVSDEFGGEVGLLIVP